MITNLNETNFEEQISTGLKLIDFSASWCGYCKMLRPELEQLDKIWIGYVDGDESPNLARKFRVQGYPTMVLLKNGQEVDRMVGFRPKEDILNTIMRHLK
ncbi:thioredoxin [bacterium]|nr:thioredoxin [bacterium]